MRHHQYFFRYAVPFCTVTNKIMILDITLGFINRFRNAPLVPTDEDGSTTCGDLVEFPCDVHFHMSHTVNFPL
jgi:hypothetical protein